MDGRRCTDGRALDSGNVVEFIFIVPLLVAFLLSGIDSAIYMSNRAQLQNLARNGARTVGIAGGTGTAGTPTNIGGKYSALFNSATACSTATAATGIAAGAVNASSTPVECQMASAVNATRSLIQVQVSSISCTPQVSAKVGEQTSCTITWTYGGIPGSALSFFQLNSQQTVVGTGRTDAITTLDTNG